MANAQADGGLPLALDAVPSAPPRARAARWARQLDLLIPAGLLVLIFGACFVWPAIFPLPRPVGGSIFEANLRPLSPGHVLGTDPVVLAFILVPTTLLGTLVWAWIWFRQIILPRVTFDQEAGLLTLGWKGLRGRRPLSSVIGVLT